MSSVGNGFRAAGRAAARPARGIVAVSRSRPVAVLATLSVVVVLLGVLSGFIYQQQHHYDVLAHRRQAAVAAAKQEAVALLSYRFGSIKQELRHERGALTGQFKHDYTTLVRTLVAPTAKKKHITTKAEVAAASVISARPERVEVLLYINQSISSQATKQPRRSPSRVRMTLHRVDGEWLVAQLAPV